MSYRKKFIVEPGEKVNLDQIDPSYHGNHESHEKALPEIQEHVTRMDKLRVSALRGWRSVTAGCVAGIGCCRQRWGGAAFVQRHESAGDIRVRLHAGKQGIFGTFSAFLEMCISEITMARLNNSNVLSHFSHAGIDDMADNSCHFGLNNFFADNGLSDGYATNLYFPADPLQMKACLETIFFNPGLRFVFSTR